MKNSLGLTIAAYLLTLDSNWRIAIAYSGIFSIYMYAGQILIYLLGPGKKQKYIPEISAVKRI